MPSEPCGLPRLAPNLINIPNRDYWLAPERRVATLAALDACAARTKHLRGAEAETFHQMMARLAEFVRLTNNVMEKVERAEQSSVVPWALRLLQ